MAPILAMLERVQYGNLAAVVAQALRAGAAISLGEAQLHPTEETSDRQFPRRTRFVVSKLDRSALPRNHQLYTEYDPRKPWNKHIEAKFAKCEWGETNGVLLELLRTGLMAMGYSTPADAQDQIPPVKNADQVAPQLEQLKTEPQKPSPPRSGLPTVVIGVDPTQVPAPSPKPRVSALIANVRRPPR